MVENRKLNKLKYILYNLGVGVLSWLLLCAEINDVVSPFFIAFAFALFYIENDILKYVIGLGIARLIYEFSWASVFITINLILVIIIIKLLQRKANGQFKMAAIFVFMILGSIVEFIYTLNGVERFVLGVINKLLELAFLYAYMMLFKGIRNRGTNTRLALDELLGLSLILAPVALATAKIEFLSISLAQLIIPLEILIVAYLFGGVEAIAVAIISGIGVSFKDLNLGIIAVWVFYAVGVTGVRKLGRIAMPITILLIDLIVGFYFGVYETYTIYGLIPLAGAGLIFITIPRKVINKLRLYIYNKYEETCLNEIVVQEERRLKERLKKVSSLFLEMHNIYKNMVIGKLDTAQVEEVILRDLVNQNCKNCHKYKSCYEGKGLSYRAISELVKKGVSKKKVSLIDSPTMLVSICGKTNQIIFQLNTRLEEYGAYEKSLLQEDESKVLMSNQLLGVSEVINEFGTTFTFGIRASKEQESSLIESFLYNDIIVKECAIFSDENGFYKAVVVVKNSKYKKLDFIKVASMFFKLKTRIKDIRYSKVAGWQIVTIEPDTKYIYTVGVAKTSKHEKSGDTYSETMLDESRALFAISDGKGCGMEAGKISEMTMNLIENFYKAGFSSEHIMDNVNKVMSYKSGENFSAVDVAVLDLNSGRVDFVKRGGTPTIIKKATRSQVVEGKDLPIGVLENSKSNIVNYYINSGEIIVLASDGVFDAFGCSDNFAGFINNLPAINMQEFAKNILNEAIRLNKGKIKDDMTVLAVKLLLNR